MILAIETSCDDSAVALLDWEGNVITSEISSQIDLHKKYGGVVPEIASRKHLTTLPLLMRHVIESHQVKLSDLKAVAVTYAPGLIGSLLVGVSYAKTFAWIADVPLVPVDHLEGHLLAPFLDEPEMAFPFLALVISGCTLLGPDYQVPTAPVNPQWLEYEDPRLDPEAPVTPEWWKAVFDDPILDVLVQTALAQNLSRRSAGINTIGLVLISQTWTRPSRRL